ncbi:MAG: dihydropteroate synthase [Acidobacteria bacterium]|nr:dihydropteroate synthase [Acidobacteriota bacterium]
MQLDVRDYGGERLAGCNEALVLNAPDAVLRLHRFYLEAGADIVETDTFGASPVVLAEYGLEDRAREINLRAAKLAREAADAFATSGRPRWVAGSMGPTTKSLTLIGGITFGALVAAYRIQAEGLAEGGADVLLIETSQDPLNLKAALIACRDAAPGMPVAVSATIEPGGTTLGGQTIEAVAVMVEPWRPLWIGINCSTGPGPMREHVRALAAMSPAFLSVVPNAGMPDESGRYTETPEHMAAILDSFAAQGWINILGGCCGTTDAHIRALRAVADSHAPRRPADYEPSWAAGGIAVPLRQERPPTLVGERTNALGSRRFRELLDAGRFAEAASVGRQQARRGAHLLDLCVADPSSDETARMTALVRAVRRAVRIPLMIDTTDPEVFKAALELAPGRPVLNSVNLEDGGQRLERIAALARRFGCALVAGCIDEDPDDGMARTAERKLDVARRLVDVLEAHGLRRAEILVDPLVFPAATGDPKFAGSAAETVEGIRRIKAAIPGVLTLAGISNVSFGLPAAARKVVNAVFLHRCVEAGLDAAIVNTQALVRIATLDPDDVRLVEAILFEGDRAAIDALVERFRGVRERRAGELEQLPPAERLTRMVIEGEQTGLEATVAALLETMEPLEIINGPLMAGMDEVGRLFGDGQLIVAEVLVSAEVMQAAVDLIRPHLRGEDSADRGSILLATVRGDVHDIGKNLVSMIFSTNGWRVVDLGVQVPSERLIEAWRAERTDIIGLSGLLVRSAHQMVATAKDLAAGGVDVPVLVGGAALNPRFVREKIAPAHAAPVRYAKDALEGLRLANAIASGQEVPGDEAPRHATASVRPERGRSAPVRTVEPLPPEALPSPPDLARHVLPGIALDEVLPYLNVQMLLGKHLGLGGPVRRLLARGDLKATELAARVDALTDEALAHGWLAPAGVFRFLRAWSEGEDAVLADAGGNELERLRFPATPRRSAAAWIHPDPDAHDTIALMVVTAGPASRVAAEALKNEGRLLDSFALQALALETAEATAEWLHRRIRALWGFPDPPRLSIANILKARYRGIRLSPGYPALPDLEMQRPIFRLLRPSEIGIELTEGLMMNPEASVSAVVLHHPEARY